MKYLRYKIVSIQDVEVRTHIYTIDIIFSNIFLEVFVHKFYLIMECVTLFDNTGLQHPPKNHNLEKKKHTLSTDYWP